MSLNSQDCRLFTASLLTHAKEKASEASSKHAGGCGVAREASKKSIFLGPHPHQVKFFVLRWSSVLAILPARSTVELKYEKIEDCKQPIKTISAYLAKDSRNNFDH